MKTDFSPLSSKLLALALVGCVAIAASTASAQDKKPGRVFGKVVDSAGKPAPDVVIKLSVLEVIKGGGGKGGVKGSKSAFGMPDLRQLMMFQQVVATTKTDSAGAYEFKSLQPRTHIYDAGNPSTVGYGGGSFKVISGQSIEINITLEAPGVQGQ